MGEQRLMRLPVASSFRFCSWSRGIALYLGLQTDLVLCVDFIVKSLQKSCSGSSLRVGEVGRAGFSVALVLDGCYHQLSGTRMGE